MKQLRKSNKKIITGVCGGIAEFIKIDPTIVRLLVALICVFTKGIGLVIYIVAAFVMPEAEFADEDIANMKSANFDNSESFSQKNGSEGKNTEGDESASSPRTNEEFDKFFKK